MVTHHQCGSAIFACEQAIARLAIAYDTERERNAAHRDAVAYLHDRLATAEANLALCEARLDALGDHIVSQFHS
jgi:hypothetical protein